MSERKSGGRGSRPLKTRVKTARGRKTSSTRWLQRQLNDPYVQAARAERERDGGEREQRARGSWHAGGVHSGEGLGHVGVRPTGLGGGAGRGPSARDEVRFAHSQLR